MDKLAQEYVWYQAPWTNYHCRPFRTFAHVLVVRPAGVANICVAEIDIF